MSVNRIMVVGRLTKDPEVRQSNSGTTYTRIGVAVDRFSGGEKQVDFLDFTILGKAAENVPTYTSKGTLCYIEGAVQSRRTEEGTRLSLVAYKVDALSKPASAPHSTVRGGATETQFLDEPPPW